MVDISHIDRASIGQYGVYLVAAELCRLGYTAVTTSRNTKAVDILAFNPTNGVSVGIQVKTGRVAALPVLTASINEIDHQNLLTPFVFVYIAGEKSYPRFFVVPRDEVLQQLEEDRDQLVRNKKKKGKAFDPKVKTRWSIQLKRVKPYENKWENLGLDLA